MSRSNRKEGHSYKLTSYNKQSYLVVMCSTVYVCVMCFTMFVWF